MTQTAVEKLVEEINKLTGLNISMDEPCVEQAKEMEKEQIKEELIGFQIYLNDEGLIENHDWDFEKEAKVYLYDNKK